MKRTLSLIFFSSLFFILGHIFVHKLILILMLILFGLHHFSSSFYYISNIILVLVFIPFFEYNFSRYLVLVLV